MRIYRREIVITILTALATLSAVCYFFGDMKKSKELAQTDLYTLTAPAPEAILAVNRPAVFAKVILTKEPVYQAFASEIPDIYLNIIRKNPEIASLHLSFHPQGVVMYAKADNNIVRQIEENVLKLSPIARIRETSSSAITNIMVSGWPVTARNCWRKWPPYKGSRKTTCRKNR